MHAPSGLRRHRPEHVQTRSAAQYSRDQYRERSVHGREESLWEGSAAGAAGLGKWPLRVTTSVATLRSRAYRLFFGFGWAVALALGGGSPPPPPSFLPH